MRHALQLGAVLAGATAIGLLLSAEAALAWWRELRRDLRALQAELDRHACPR